MDKKTFRKEIKARIAALDSTYIAESDNAIAQNIISLPEFISAPRVFTYLSMDREADTRNIIEHCLALGKTVALPCDCENGAMSFARLDRPVAELPLGSYGIPTPPDASERLTPENGDIILVPALCYDESCYRLGHGGGYYDRYLSAFPVFSIGLCREKLLVAAVPTDEFDKRVDVLVTEKRIARPNWPRKNRD